MMQRSRENGVKPWMVAVALAFAGLVGGAGIWFSANAIRKNDRATVREWEARAAPILDRTWVLYREVQQTQAAASADGGVPASRRASLRGMLDAARSEIQRLFSVPPILEPVGAEYQKAVARIGDALGALDRIANGEAAARTDLETALSFAERHLREGDARRQRLRARLDL